ncbi:MAG: hypothetical protein LBQ61_09165 [Spirochaetales bacterium]|jgi:methyl-accepting chemotaxis protein|nr:hypothetical protein [Spirochaetales bacterium]
MGTRQRKKFLIDLRLQFSMVGTFLLSVFLSLLLFSLLTAGYYWIQGMAGNNVFKEYITIYRQEVREEGEGTREIAGVKRWQLILPPLLLNNLIILVMVLIMGLIYSHRIAGPVYRMEKDLGRVLAGERQVRIVTRKKDKMGRLVGQINEVLAELDRLAGRGDGHEG